MKIKYALFILLMLNLCLFSQPGKLGNLTVNANMVLNSYCPVTTNISAGTYTINVLAQSAMLNLCPGDLIMIYQAQGATILNTNTVNYGDVTAYNSAGLYQFNYVKSVSGNLIITTNPILNNFLAAGMTQVIKVPLYNILTINTGFKILAKNWKDTVVSSVRYRYGGVTAIHANNINNNGSITASGAGFRGGVADTINYGFNYSSFSGFTSTVVTNGGEKGESIAGFHQEYDLIGGRYGRGAAANGGGGGNGWNSGGGGGANANNGNVWSGQGVMSNTVTGSSAWSLDPGYIANSNTLTNSSGGGRGGYSVGFNAQNPLAVGPNNGSWGADGRKEVGGLGGRPLTNFNPGNRIYFGGGGGAGDDNNNSTKNGGNGGGIVFLITNGIAGIGVISSDGDNGGDSKNAGLDAVSGAGAGGSIVIISGSTSVSQTVTAIGGRGGNQVISSAEFEGPGGGGGGGYIATNFGPLPFNVSGGANGTTNSGLMTGFPANGATAAAAGQFLQVSTIPFLSFNINSILTLTANTPVCSGSILNLGASLISGATYQWNGPNMYSSSQQNPAINNVVMSATGNYTSTVSMPGCVNISNSINVVINDCTGLPEFVNDESSVNVYPSPTNEKFVIELKDKAHFELEIYNSIGQKVISNSSTNGYLLIETTDLNAGVYYAVITSGGKAYSKKIVKE